MRQFDLHEFLGYIAPGMLLLVGISIVWPEGREALKLTDLSIGGLGVGVVVAYAVGQLLQAVGNGIESLWWRLWGGAPTDWLRTKKHELIDPDQAARVEEKVSVMLGKQGFALQPSISRGAWYSITREVYAAVSAAGLSRRIDIFNGNYGLCRGIAAGLAVVAIWSVAVDWAAWQLHLATIGLFVLAVYRMHLFGVRYGREVFVQFLRGPNKKGDEQ